MKNIIVFITCLVLTIPVFAEEVPSYLKDATIVVTLKNGKSYSYSANDYKVVRRGSGITSEQLDKSNEFAKKVGEVVGANRAHYSVILTGGIGQDGLTSRTSGNVVEVETRTKAVGQATGCYTKDKGGICGTISTNEFYGLGIKFDLN